MPSLRDDTSELTKKQKHSEENMLMAGTGEERGREGVREFGIDV